MRGRSLFTSRALLSRPDEIAGFSAAKAYVRSMPSLSKKNCETESSGLCLEPMQMKMKAMAFLLGAIPTLAMTGCEMDLEEMDEAELAELEAYEGVEAMDLGAVEGSAPEMGATAMLPGVLCNEVFDVVSQGPSSGGLLPVVAYSYQQSSFTAPKVVQGLVGHRPITNGIRAQGVNVQEQGFSGADEVQIDLVKNFFGRWQRPSSIRVRLANNVSFLVNKSFTTRGCQQFANHATVFADSTDGSQLTMTYQWLFPGG